MNGREDKKANDLFYTCSLIAFIARKTKNKPSYIVDVLGADVLYRIYELADIYHSDNIERVSEDFINECHIGNGNFDNVASCEYAVPTHWDIGKAYKRLILKAAETEQADIIDTLRKVYHSVVSELIEDYNSSFYYDNPMLIFETYQNGGLLM